MTRLMLGMLDKAQLRLGDNNVVNFERTLIFMTSNVGAHKMQRTLAPGMGFQGNANAGLIQSSVSVARFGARAPNAATSNKRIVGQCVLKAAAPVLNDEFIIRFSNAGQPSGGHDRAAGTVLSGRRRPVDFRSRFTRGRYHGGFQ